VTAITELLDRMKRNPGGVRFSDLCKVCDHYFGKARQAGTSHRVYRTPWIGNPRVNIQSRNGLAKAYQVRQVTAAIALLESSDETD
jgi:hypothetical protein